MKLFLMVKTSKDNLTEDEKEKLCWDMIHGSSVYDMVCRESMEELKDALCEEGE